MNGFHRITKVVCLLAFMCCEMIFAPASNGQEIASEEDSTQQAWISIFHRHSGLPVFVDGFEVGVTPLNMYTVAAGQHEIGVIQTVTKSWLDPDWKQTVTLEPGDTMVIEPKFHRGYVINSQPYGAQVWVEGKVAGTTPYVLRLAEQSTARVEVTLNGYRPASLLLGELSSSPPDSTPARTYNLTLEQDFNYAVMLEKQSLRRSNRIRNYRRWTYLAASLTAASGIAAVLFKSEADDAYGQYLRNADPARREHYFDRAADYDRYSGIAFGAFEVSFALTFFSFLKSIQK